MAKRDAEERLEQLERSIRDLQAVVAESRAMQDQVFITLKGLQKTIDDGVVHLEKWCERLQDTVDHHLAVCAETASVMLAGVQSSAGNGKEVVDQQ